MIVPDNRHVASLIGVSFAPVFIMGDHRSGTTLLYQLLAGCGGFNVVKAYHIVCYNALLDNYLNGTEEQAKKHLAEQFTSLGLDTRLIDNVKVTPDLPEEYGFLFKNSGSKSQLNIQTLPRFEELCRKVQFISDPAKPILLKNPWDYLNFMYVKKLYPAARFIFIHRHPLHTINSQLKATRSIMAVKNEYQALIADWYRRLFDKPVKRYLATLIFSSSLGFRIVLRHVSLAARYFLEHVSHLNETDYISIRYEDLCADPHVTVGSILAFLQMPHPADAAYETMVKMREPQLLEEVRRSEGLIAKHLSSYLVYGKYDAQT